MALSALALERTWAVEELNWIVRLFSDMGIDGEDPNQQDGDGLTVLHYAVASDHVKAVRQLIEGGARVDIRDKEGRTALHRAASNTVAELLLHAGADLEARDEVGWTPLHKASRRGHSGAVTALISWGANIEALDAESRTPLHKAALRGHAEIVMLLIKAGSNVSARDEGGNTPLSWATAHGHEQVVEVLQEHASC